jgi:hypothetical protein
MSTVAEIIEAVKKLPESERGKFLQRLVEIDFEDDWDRRMDADAKAGRLNHLIDEAIGEHRAGQSQPFP